MNSDCHPAWQPLSSSIPRQLLVAFKVAEVCNLKCGYCYFFEKNDLSYLSSPAFMPNSTVRDAAAFLGRGAASLGVPVVSVALHGGEPLMMGKKRLAAVCEILQREISPHAELRLGIQTNGVLLDPDWIALLASFDCSIGVSLDGPRRFHDPARPDKKGRGSFDATIRAIRLLQEAERAGVISSYGILSVVDPRISMAEFYRFFFDELEAYRVHARPPALTWECFDSGVIESVNRSMIQCFHEWSNRDNPALEVRTNIEALHPFLHDDGVMARVSNILDLAYAISIRSNGDVCPDDSLPPLNAQYRELGINVSRHSLAQLYDHPVWKTIADAFSYNESGCRECEWFGICGGGPHATRYSESGQLSRRSVYCAGFKELFAAGKEYCDKYLDPSETERRKVLASELLRALTQPEGVLDGLSAALCRPSN